MIADNLVRIFDLIQQLHHYGLKLSYIWHSILVYMYHLMINIYNRNKERFLIIMLEFLFLMYGTFMMIYNEVISDIQY